MTTENILKEISDAIKLNNESKVTTNEALCHAGNVIRSLEKKIKEECAEGDKRYEQGIKDAWDLACDICCSTAFGGLTNEQLEMVFGKDTTMGVMDNYSYENAKKKMEEFLAKKEEEIDKPGPIVKGDVVICTADNGDGDTIEGIFCGDNGDDHFYLLIKEYECVQRYPSYIWSLSKTGKHVDLDW